MRVLAGPLLTREGWREGHVRVEHGRIVETRFAPPQGPVDARGVLVPAFVNAHTHLGDAVARGPGLPASLEEAVRPPHGYKHRVLAATPPAQLVAGMRGALAEADADGCAGVVDFREGGPTGVARLREALAGSPVRARILGRPGGLDFDAGEVRALVAAADGVAVSSLPDYGAARAATLAGAARAAGKPFALHHAEPGPEPLDPVLDLRPALLVHLTHCTPGDLARVADAAAAVAVCPRSNLRWLRRVPDVRAMLDAGLLPGLGTDNAMLGPLDLRAEARALLDHAKDVTPLEAVRMLALGGRAALGLGDPWAPGSPADLLVFAPQGSRPEAAVLAPRRWVHRERGLSGN